MFISWKSKWTCVLSNVARYIERGYYTVAQRYEFYFRVEKTIFYERTQRVSKINCFHHEKIKFISASRRVIFFILHRNALACNFKPYKRKMTSSISSLVRIWEICHWGPGCSFVWVLRTVYLPVKHSCLYWPYGTEFHALTKWIGCLILRGFHCLVLHNLPRIDLSTMAQ